MSLDHARGTKADTFPTDMRCERRKDRSPRAVFADIHLLKVRQIFGVDGENFVLGVTDAVNR